MKKKIYSFQAIDLFRKHKIQVVRIRKYLQKKIKFEFFQICFERTFRFKKLIHFK